MFNTKGIIEREEQDTVESPIYPWSKNNDNRDRLSQELRPGTESQYIIIRMYKHQDCSRNN
jgi:hypothetical protein